MNIKEFIKDYTSLAEKELTKILDGHCNIDSDLEKINLYDDDKEIEFYIKNNLIFSNQNLNSFLYKCGEEEKLIFHYKNTYIYKVDCPESFVTHEYFSVKLNSKLINDFKQGYVIPKELIQFLIDEYNFKPVQTKPIDEMCLLDLNINGYTIQSAYYDRIEEVLVFKLNN